MKIGILTFHCAHNYGAVLQAYGLQEYLRDKGYDAYIIDYRPEYKTKSYPSHGKSFWISKHPIWLIRGVYNYIVHKNIRLGRWNAFDKFSKEKFHLFSFNEGEDMKDFDAVLIGSDQVWSSRHTGGSFDRIYFGDGLKCKVISYAPSCTTMDLSDNEKTFISEHIDAMKAVSVREPFMKDVLQPLTKNDIAVVVDPTLLAGVQSFEKIAAPIKRKRPYILTYEIRPHKEVYTMAKKMAAKLDADLIELTNGVYRYHRNSMHENATPEEFLGYIKNAACVITTSFHGTALSLLFHTPFYTVLQHNAADTRMKSLLTALDLKDRIIEMEDIPNIEPLNDKKLDSNLNNLRQNSENFIAKALSQN